MKNILYFPYSGVVANPMVVTFKNPEQNEIISYDTGLELAITQNGKIVSTVLPTSQMKKKIRLQYADVKYEEYRQLTVLLARYFAVSGSSVIALKWIDWDGTIHKVKPAGSSLEGAINGLYKSGLDAYSFNLILEILS